jgi:NADH:ubiquinone oxidoreductase subunit K
MEAASTTGTVPALPVSGYLMLAGVLLSIGSGGLVRRRA